MAAFSAIALGVLAATQMATSALSYASQKKATKKQEQAQAEALAKQEQERVDAEVLRKQSLIADQESMNASANAADNAVINMADPTKAGTIDEFLSNGLGDVLNG